MDFALNMMGFVFKMMDFALNMMVFVFKMMDFALNMMVFVLKMMDFALKMMGFVFKRAGKRRRRLVPPVDDGPSTARGAGGAFLAFLRSCTVKMTDLTLRNDGFHTKN